MVNKLATCTSPYCPERQGGVCQAELGIDSAETLASIFLDESNKIEGIYDKKSLEQARKAWDYLIKQEKIDGAVIQKTHYILMKYQDLPRNEKGYWRQCEVMVGAYTAPNHTLIPEGIAQWLWANSALFAFSKGKQYNDLGKNPEILAHRIKTAHIYYERLHPFVDGNGRTGRMFMNWQRLKLGLPLMVIFDIDKQDYYQWFK